VVCCWFGGSLPYLRSFHTLTKMTTTFQRNALDTSYNGWENYETWNIALWISNTEGLYHLAQEFGNYEDTVEALKELGVYKTPDGVYYNDPEVNVVQLNSNVFDL
jgi:hypothetical protein